jgi:hypothetical protein
VLLIIKLMFMQHLVILLKAFDCINHEMLLAEPKLYGIRGMAGQWFKSCPCKQEATNRNKISKLRL